MSLSQMDYKSEYYKLLSANNRLIRLLMMGYVLRSGEDSVEFLILELVKGDKVYTADNMVDLVNKVYEIEEKGEIVFRSYSEFDVSQSTKTI